MDILCHRQLLLWQLMVVLLIKHSSSVQTFVQQSDPCFKADAEKTLNDILIIISSSMPADSAHQNPPQFISVAESSSRESYKQFEHKCGLIRQALARVLMYSGPCYLSDAVKFEEEIKLASLFLRQYCDEHDHWTQIACYSSKEVKSCEASFIPSAINLANAAIECPVFHNFYTCARKAIDQNCHHKDQSHYSVYFLDKALDEAWKCGSGLGDIHNSSHEVIDRMSGSTHRHDTYGPRPSNYPSFTSHSGAFGPTGSNQFSGPHPPIHGSNYAPGSFNQPAYQGPNFPSQAVSTSVAYPDIGHGGLVNPEMSAQDPIMSVRPGPYGDHQFSLFPAENCIERTSYYARGCEEYLLHRQREARNARTGFDVQRRICCSLFFYHDCLSKTVIQYCRDASPTTVDIMMGQRKREIAITCRDHSREHCNSSNKISTYSIATILMTLVSFYLFY